jgi:hypothetical protein
MLEQLQLPLFTASLIDPPAAALSGPEAAGAGSGAWIMLSPDTMYQYRLSAQQLVLVRPFPATAVQTAINLVARVHCLLHEEYKCTWHRQPESTLQPPLVFGTLFNKSPAR